MAKFICERCGKIFSRKLILEKHIQRVHNVLQRVFDCIYCKEVFLERREMLDHRKLHEPSTSFSLRRHAHNRKCTLHRKVYTKKMHTFDECFKDDRPELQKLLTYSCQESNIKAALSSTVEFLKMSPSGEVDEDITITVRTKTVLLQNEQDVVGFLQDAYYELSERIDNFISLGSGWILDEVLFSDVEISACAPLSGSCTLLGLTFPKSLDCIPKLGGENGKTCFFEAVAYGLMHQKTQNISEISNFIEKHLYTSVATPVKLTDIPKFELENEHMNFKINVIHVAGEDFSPIYTSKINPQAEQTINLLLYKAILDGKVIYHYALIEDLTKLIRRTYGESGRNKTYSKTQFCENCFQPFSSSLLLTKHKEICQQNAPQQIIMPEKDEIIQFSNFNKQFKVEFIGFFDFEAALSPPEYRCERCNRKSQAVCDHKTQIEHVQDPISYSLVIVNSEGEVQHTSIYSGEDCVTHFYNELLTIESTLVKRIQTHKPMIWNLEAQNKFSASSSCHICKKNFSRDDLVRDHCHKTGLFLGAACSPCNLKRTECTTIPLFCHNFTSYDSHFLVKHMRDDSRILKSSVLPSNSEKFRCMDVNNYRFIDSLQFLNGSLEKLSSELASSGEHSYSILDGLLLYDSHEDHKKKMLLKKGFFPYEYCSSLKKMRESQFPPIEEFFSNLKNAGISQEDYEHAEEVYNLFECSSMLEYCELYCTTDTALLAELVMRFRKEIFEKFNLEVAHYISLPQLAYDAMLKRTGVTIELISDVDQLMFVENNIRGGLSFIAERHAERGANPRGFTDLIYIDANNLYGKAQRERQPIGDYRWMSEEDISKMDWTATTSDSSRGYIVEVDLHYPKHLHEFHNSFPVGAEKTRITSSMLSEYASGEKNA